MRDEQTIITNAFYLSELDVDVWEDGDDEYELARGFLNLGISRWESYENTLWRELLTHNSDGDGDTETVTDTHQYDCASNFMYPGGWVRTNQRVWTVIKPEKVSNHISDPSNWCYFLGDESNGFTLNFNPLTTINGGETITYDYYRKALRTSDPANEVEMADPYFLSYFIAAHLGEDGIDRDMFTIAETRLDQMMVKNMSGVFGVPDQIDTVDDFSFGE